CMSSKYSVCCVLLVLTCAHTARMIVAYNFIESLPDECVVQLHRTGNEEFGYRKCSACSGGTLQVDRPDCGPLPRRCCTETAWSHETSCGERPSAAARRWRCVGLAV